MRAKTPSGGQIALRRTGAMQFQITSRGKDYAGMPKSKIEIEMVDLLTSLSRFFPLRTTFSNAVHK